MKLPQSIQLLTHVTTTSPTTSNTNVPRETCEKPLLAVESGLAAPICLYCTCA